MFFRKPSLSSWSLLRSPTVDVTTDPSRAGLPLPFFFYPLIADIEFLSCVLDLTPLLIKKGFLSVILTTVFFFFMFCYLFQYEQEVPPVLQLS